MTESRFHTNANILKKIITENIWFGQDNKDQALEFLEAMISNHNDEINECKANMLQLQAEETFDPDEDEEFEDEFAELDYGLGKLRYCTDELNIKFFMELEQFVESFKNK